MRQRKSKEDSTFFILQMAHKGTNLFSFVNGHEPHFIGRRKLADANEESLRWSVMFNQRTIMTYTKSPLAPGVNTPESETDWSNQRVISPP